MNVFGFIKTTMKKEYHKYISFALILMVALIICFLFTDIINNPLLVGSDKAVGGGTWQEVDVPLSKGLPFIVVFLSWIMIFYASNFFLNNQCDSFALLLLSGGSMFDVAKFVLLEIMFIFIIIVPISLIIGTFLLEQIYVMIFAYLNIGTEISIAPLSYVNILYSLFMILIVICVNVAGFSFRHTLQVLLGRAQEKKKVKIKRHSIASLLYFLVYISAIIIILSQKHTLAAYILPAGFGFLGIYGILKNTVPKLVTIWKDKKGIEKQKLYISLSNYVVSMQGTFVFSMLILVLICGLIPVLISQDKMTNEYITGLLCYVVITILIVVSIVYKFLDIIMARYDEFLSLNRLGYINKELKSIIFYEVFFYYMTIIVLPLPIVLSIGTRYIMNYDLTVINLVTLIGIYTVPTLLSMIVTYIIYMKTMIKKGEKA